MSKKVCVTGASGFLASHIVAQLLEKGYEVHGTVRDATKSEKTDHLMKLSGAKERLHLFSTGDLGDEKTGPGSFDAAVAGCEAVVHAATPVMFGSKDGENQIFNPAIASTKEILKAIERAGTVKTVVLTSSMAAVAPKPEPAVKNESHWSDEEKQKAANNWYGATKTCQEKLIQKYVSDCEEKKNDKNDKKAFRFVAICPTGIFGPMLQPSVNATMGWVLSLYKNGKNGDKAANDSMSFIDVRDCAAQHVAAVENDKVTGRYMSLVESRHWNDIFTLMKKLHPNMPSVPACDGDPIEPTKFDLTRMNTLGVKVRSVEDILKAALDDFKQKGLL